MPPSADTAELTFTSETSAPDPSPESLRTDPRMLAEVRRLSRVSEVRGLAAIAVEWAVIIAAIAFWCSLPASLGMVRWLLYVPVIVIIASRQHALLILMHEGAHMRLSKNRAWNNFVADMFCSFPVALYTDHYRQHHLQHHQFTNSDKDPDITDIKPREDWDWPKDQIDAFRLFATDFIGLAAYRMASTLGLWSPLRNFLFKRKLNVPRADRLRVLVFCASALAILAAYNLWLIFFMFWFVPYLTALVPIIRLRTVSEHMVVESEHELNKTRHVDPTLLERLIISPLNVNYHLAHHLYPSIPFYNLPEMHRILMGEDLFRDNAHLTSTYWGLRQGVWAEITRPKAQMA